MSMEFCCGQCQGRLLVQSPGEIVACPHCGVHLRTPLPESPPAASADGLHDEILSRNGLDQFQKHSAETMVVKGSDIQADDQSPSLASFHAYDDATNRHVDENVDAERDLSQSQDVAERDEVTEHTVATPETDSISAQVPPGIHTELAESNAADESVLDATSLPEPATSGQEQAVRPGPTEHDIVRALPQFDGASQTPPADQDFSWMSALGSMPTPRPGAPVNLNFDLAPVVRQDKAMSEMSWEMPSVAATQPEARLNDGIPTDAFSPRSHASTTTPQFVTFETPLNDSLRIADEQGKKPRSSTAIWLLIVGSYASLLTIYVVYMSLFGRKHQLESLPDLKTVQQMGGRALVPRPENDLPPGHDLQLGQSQRFGNIVVTPLRVTRGSISFAHFTGDQTKERAASEPVLKLWIKFENASSDQAIAPLDTTLMFFRRVVENRVASYNAIFQANQRKETRPYFPFDRVAENSEWNIVGQHTNETLLPGDSFETFIPSEEQIDDLDCEIIWRVHFRKGFGAKSGNGVTTLLDVHFLIADVTADPV